MPTKTLVFCHDGPGPTLMDILEMLSEEAFDIHLSEEAEEEKEDPLWNEVMLIYSDEEEPIQLECWRNDDSDEFAEIRDDLVENIEGFENSEKVRVIEHLKRCDFVLSIEETTSDNEEGLSIYNALIVYFASNFKGLAYIETEGVYEADELILRMD